MANEVADSPVVNRSERRLGHFPCRLRTALKVETSVRACCDECELGLGIKWAELRLGRRFYEAKFALKSGQWLDRNDY